MLAEGFKFAGAGEVDGAFGGENSGEEAEMVCDALGDGGVGGCGEVDGATGGVLLLKVLEQFAVVGEMGDVELDGVGDVAFKRGFTLHEPAGKLEEIGGTVAGEEEGGIDESI